LWLRAPRSNGLECRRWTQHLDRGRPCRGSATDLDMRLDDAVAAEHSRRARFERGARSHKEWLRTIAADRLHALIYPEIGMDRWR